MERAPGCKAAERSCKTGGICLVPFHSGVRPLISAQALWTRVGLVCPAWLKVKLLAAPSHGPMQ